MSYSLSVYSTNEHLFTREELHSQMVMRGWIVAFTPDLNDNTLLDFQGEVRDGMIVYGWKAGTRGSSEFSQFLAEGNIQSLWTAPQAEGSVFSCQVTYTAPYDAQQDWDEEELDELEEADEEYVGALRRARVAYEITSGKRPGSIEFSHQVWRAIGGLVGGLLDNAQTGEHQFPPQP